MENLKSDSPREDDDGNERFKSISCQGYNNNAYLPTSLGFECKNRTFGFFSTKHISITTVSLLFGTKFKHAAALFIALKSKLSKSNRQLLLQISTSG